MQNNKYIFLEQQKFAIKLASIIETPYDEFIDNLCQHRIKHFGATKEQEFKGIFPSAHLIYYKDFHFLDEPVIASQKGKDALT